METICYGPECRRKSRSRGLCIAHYTQQQRGAALTPLQGVKRDCDHPGCDRKHHAGGLCSSHYRQFKKYGKTFDMGALYHWPKSGFSTDEEFFWSKVKRSTDCWLWCGQLTWNGYGVFKRGRKDKTHMAHRFSYELHQGEIPVGVQVDHICHNRACVNPKHLRLATPSQNSQNRKGARRDSTSGIRGVSKNGSRFSATVVIDGKSVYLGTFDTPAEAGDVAKQARLNHYTHNYVDRMG